MFIMFLDFVSLAMVAPLHLLENHLSKTIFSHFRPADGTSYYARKRFPLPSHHNFLNYSETPPTCILAEL